MGLLLRRHMGSWHPLLTTMQYSASTWVRSRTKWTSSREKLMWMCKTPPSQLERAGFCDEFVDRMNRWRSQEGAKGRAVKHRMNAHYTEAVLLMPTTWLSLYVL